MINESTFSSGTGPACSSGEVKLFFVDSGAVEGSKDYTTFFVIHGAAFTLHTFKNLLPLASHANVRFVLIHRRGYPGSTPYTDVDIARMHVGDPTFLQDVGREFLHFMGWFVAEHNIPCISSAADGAKKGGAVILGWSAGTISLLATLAYASSNSKEYVEALEPYLRTGILYDPPVASFGLASPPGVPALDISVVPDINMAMGFGQLVSSTYTHPDLASRQPSGLNFSVEGLPGSSCLASWSDEERALYFLPELFLRVDLPNVFEAMVSRLREQTDLALLSDSPKVFPSMDIKIVSCKNTIWSCIYGRWEIERVYAEAQAEGKNLRKMETLEIDGDHFVHFKHPERFMQVLKASVAN